MSDSSDRVTLLKSVRVWFLVQVLSDFSVAAVLTMLLLLREGREESLLSLFIRTRIT